MSEKDFLNRTELEDSVMSNFDHEIDYDVADKLNDANYADYPAWNFHAKIIKKDSKYVARVSQYKEVVAYITKDTLQEIIDECSERWGCE